VLCAEVGTDTPGMLSATPGGTKGVPGTVKLLESLTWKVSSSTIFLQLAALMSSATKTNKYDF